MKTRWTENPTDQDCGSLLLVELTEFTKVDENNPLSQGKRSRLQTLSQTGHMAKENFGLAQDGGTLVHVFHKILGSKKTTDIFPNSFSSL